MRKVLLAAALAAVLPAAAAASPALALRVGYESSSGSVTTGTSMSDMAKGDYPLQLDALWRFGEHFSLGVYYSFAIGQLSRSVSDACSSIVDTRTGEHIDASCSVWSMRAGIRGEYAFPEASQRLVPWIGVGTGWEWVHESVSASRGSGAQTVSGWEILSLEAGADLKVARRLSLGPYVDYRFGQYGRLEGRSIENQAFHSWAGVGLRGRWDF